MKVFITGASGFVGRWLVPDLEHAGHEITTGPRQEGRQTRLDVRDPKGLSQALAAAQPDAVVHLAAISSAGAAAADPQAALEITAGGTLNLLEAVGASARTRSEARAPVVLVVGSSEVYGSPDPADLPLGESTPLRPRTTYALTKAAQEAVALAYGARLNLPLVVVRSFNHIGPGQRTDFVVPALAQRVLDVRDGRAREIAVGNMDVRRDFTDVRDVARAYRLILEALADARLGRGGRVLNVCSGESVSIRRIVELLSASAGVEPRVSVEPSLVRAGEPAEIRGDAHELRAATGWMPEIALPQTLADVWHDLAGRAPVALGARRT